MQYFLALRRPGGAPPVASSRDGLRKRMSPRDGPRRGTVRNFGEETGKRTRWEQFTPGRIYTGTDPGDRPRRPICRTPGKGTTGTDPENRSAELQGRGLRRGTREDLPVASSGASQGRTSESPFRDCSEEGHWKPLFWRTGLRRKTEQFHFS